MSLVIPWVEKPGIRRTHSTTDALLRRKNKKRLIIDLDSTEDPAHSKQEEVPYNSHFAKIPR